MATSQLSRVVQTLRRASLSQAGLTDGQLLESYIRSREEGAFAALVHRHGPMVWGVCRRTLRSHQDAEDAFQAAFLVLVRKAASLREREKVANWLYGVAHHMALKARTTAAKRQAKEKQVTAMPEPALQSQTLGNDLLPLLDQELSRLPDKYREVIVLCDLDGKTRKEAARHLELPEGTVASRLATARSMLAKRLGRRGVAVSGAALAAVLSQNAASASVPLTVASKTIKAASLFAAGQAAAPGVLSVKAVALAEGAFKTMLLTKLKIATAVLVALAVLGAGAAALTHQVLAEQAADPPPQEKKEPADQPKEKKDADQAPKRVHGRVKAVDVASNTLTLSDKEVENTYTVAKDAEIRIDGQPGKLAELPPGPRIQVTLTLSADAKTALKVEAEGPHFPLALVKSVDAEKNTVTFEETKRSPELDGKTLPLRKDAYITIDGRPGKLADVPPGAVLSLHLCVDQQTIRMFGAGGQHFGGVVAVKSVDAENNTITFSDDKAPAELAGKTLPVAKDADIRIDGKSGKLADVLAGAFVSLNLAVDQKTVRGLRAEGPSFAIVLMKACDAEKNTVTFDEKKAPAELAGKTFPVAQDADIRIDGKPNKLGGMFPGSTITYLGLSVDRRTVRRMSVEGSSYYPVLVKAVDAEKGTITFDEGKAPGELAGKAFPLAPDAHIEIDRKLGKLAGIPAGAWLSVTMSADQQSVRRLSAEGPSFPLAVVKAVDLEKHSITFEEDRQPPEVAGKTLPVAKDAEINIARMPGQLFAIRPGVTINLTLSVDLKTVRRIAFDPNQ